MDIKSKEVNGQSVMVKVAGRLNIDEVQGLEREFEKLVSRKKFVALDLSGLKYIDSSGIGFLIKAMNAAKNLSMELILVDITPQILQVFKLAYLDKFFTILTAKELHKQYPQFKA